MKGIIKKGLVHLLVPLLVLLNCPVYGSQTTEAPQEQPTTEVMHKPADEVTAGKRITIYAEVEDTQGVDLVRVYFKAADGAHYNFIPMAPGEKIEKGMFEKFKQLGSDFNGTAYTATLPAPANGAKSIEYLLLVKNSENKVVKTQTYTVPVKDSDDQQVQEAPIKVYTEMAEAPTELTGFADNITFDIVESAGKFGVVAGLYSTLTTGGEGAVSSGTIAASTGGFTTTAAVVAGAAAVAVVGGAAVAGGGGGGSGGGEELTSQTILGGWSVSGSHTDGRTTSGTVTFNDGGGYSYNFSDSGSGSGSWNLSGTNLVMSFDKGAVYNGTVSGDSKNFTMKSSNGWTLNYSR